MSGVTKLSISLPKALAEALKHRAAERGIPLSQLVAETVEREARSTRFRERLAEAYGPLTEGDRASGRALLESARTPDEIVQATRLPR
jgi:hypothetical protein